MRMLREINSIQCAVHTLKSSLHSDMLRVYTFFKNASFLPQKIQFLKIESLPINKILAIELRVVLVKLGLCKCHSLYIFQISNKVIIENNF